MQLVDRRRRCREGGFEVPALDRELRDGGFGAGVLVAKVPERRRVGGEASVLVCVVVVVEEVGSGGLNDGSRCVRTLVTLSHVRTNGTHPVAEAKQQSCCRTRSTGVKELSSPVPSPEGRPIPSPEGRRSPEASTERRMTGQYSAAGSSPARRSSEGSWWKSAEGRERAPEALRRP